MKLSVYTYNSTAINDVTNYISFMPDDNKLQGDARIIDVNRSGRRPVHAAKILNAYQLRLIIQMRGTATSQIDALKTLFNVEDETPRKLICKDTANSDKQWYVYATPFDMPRLVSKDSVEVILSVADPVWYEETESSDAWTITASGQTNAVTVEGNLPARPRFVITPTAAAGSRYAYRRLALWRNPNAVAMLNEPLNIVNTVWDTAALIAATTNHAHVAAAGIDAVVTTIPYDTEAGTFPTAGMAYCGTEQFSYTGKSGGNLTGCTRGINGTTAAVHAGAAQINQSYIQADGDDIRVYLDGIETNRWLQEINTANTKVWIALDFQPAINLTLKTAIADAGAVATIYITVNSTMLAAMKRLPPSGQVLIDSELFTYTGVNLTAYTLTGCTRATKGTVAAAHTIGDFVYWIEHEIFVYYGNQTADAPDTDDTHKPIFDLTSTNTSWVYTSFWDITGLRAGSWKPALVTSANTKDPDRKSEFYTGNNLAFADPATEMGAVIKAWKYGAIWKAENATIEWSLYNPATFTEVTATGEKYRVTTNWPAYCRFMRSPNGSAWTTVWTEATPASAATWTALTAHSAVSLSTGSKFVKMSFSGAIGATADNYAAHELEAVTLTVSSTYIPQGSFNAEESCYFIDALITNNTSGEWLRVTTSMLLNTTLTIDCENKKAYLADNSPVAKISFSTVRKDWLNLSVGANTLLFTDVGSTGLTCPTYWRDRNS